MKRGKDIRNSKGKPLEPDVPREVQALMFTMVERSPGAFTLRFVCNEDLIRDLRAQGALDTFPHQDEVNADLLKFVKSVQQARKAAA